MTKRGAVLIMAIAAGVLNVGCKSPVYKMPDNTTQQISLPNAAAPAINRPADPKEVESPHITKLRAVTKERKLHFRIFCATDFGFLGSVYHEGEEYGLFYQDEGLGDRWTTDTFLPTQDAVAEALLQLINHKPNDPASSHPKSKEAEKHERHGKLCPPPVVG